MTDAVSPKLLVMLGLSIVVAGIGALRLLSAEDTALDNGFGPAIDLPIVVAPTTDSTEPALDRAEDTGRNPFARVDGEANFTPTTEVSPEDAESSPDAVAPTAATPIFPDPDLVDQDPSQANASESPALDN